MFDHTLKSLFAFPGKTDGNVAMTFGLMALPFLATIGAAIDIGQAISTQRKLQALVDTAAIAGARLPATSNQNRIAAATHIFEKNLDDSGLIGVTKTVSGSNAEVTVEAALQLPTAIMKLFGHDYFNLKSRAAARAQVDNGGIACLLALNETIADGLHMQGINKTSSDKCWAWVNSNNPTSINAAGAAIGTAQGFCTYGGVVGDEHFSPTPFRGCSRMEDPFAEKFRTYSPPVGDCVATNLQLKSGDHVLQPGIYCGNTTLKPHANVQLMPGTYVFQDGTLEIQAQSSVTGEEATLYFRGSDTALHLRGGGSLDLRAPTSGSLAGFAIVDRRIYSEPIHETVIQGGGRIKIEGIAYTPQWRMNISGNGAMNDESLCFAMIADHFYLEGNGQLHIRSDCEEAGLPQLMPKIKTGPLLLQ